MTAHFWFGVCLVVAVLIFARAIYEAFFLRMDREVSPRWAPEDAP